MQADQASSAVAPLSFFLAETNFERFNAISLPTLASPGICLTDTWSWGIVTQDPIRQNLAAELIRWLTLPEFLGPWTHAMGLLPPTAAALELWPDGTETSLVSRLVTVARPRPSAETLATFGPPIHQAVQTVLLNATPPSSAALEALNELQNR
jgi:ABC-type glycerol-3-phosphate transport system substrate-binding protein